MSTVGGPGRLGNQLVRSLAAIIIAEKHNLVMSLSCKNQLRSLGIKTKCGTNKFSKTKLVGDKEFMEYYEMPNLTTNVRLSGYFQSKLISDLIFSWLNTDSVSERIINNNKFKQRYKSNDDCFIHIRLGDVKKWNPGYNYYYSILEKIKNKKIIYIATDSPNHWIIKKLQYKYGKKINIVKYSLTDIILFGSTCKHVILSYGTFSAIIGYLSFYSSVYCLRFCKEYAWDWKALTNCDMFRNKINKIGPWIICG